MVLTRTGKSTRVKHQVNSTSSQTPAMGKNEESSVDPHLKHIKNQKLMFESEIEPCIEFVVSGIDSGEDTETLEETLSEIKELQEKLDNSVQELLDISPSEHADMLCFQLSKLKFKIRKTTAAPRKHKKETRSAEVSNVSSGNLRGTFDSSSSNPTFLTLTGPLQISQHPLGTKCQVNFFRRTLQRPLAQFNPIPFRRRLICNPILVSQRLLHLEILFTVPCLRNHFLLIQTVVQSTRTHHFMFRTPIHHGDSFPIKNSQIRRRPLHLALLHIRTPSPCPLVSRNLYPSCRQQNLMATHSTGWSGSAFFKPQ